MDILLWRIALESSERKVSDILSEFYWSKQSYTNPDSRERGIDPPFFSRVMSKDLEYNQNAVIGIITV